MIALFLGFVYNILESILEGRITTHGKIQYQFKMYDGVTIILIEIKLEI